MYAIGLHDKILHRSDTLKDLQDKVANVIIKANDVPAKMAVDGYNGTKKSYSVYICLLNTRNYLNIHHSYSDNWTQEEIKRDVLRYHFTKALAYFKIDLLEIK